MKNRRNIVELKYPPENPNDIWLKDGKFYRSTSEGWVAIGSEIEYTNKESMIADKPEGGTIGIDKETGETSIYNDVAEQWSPLSGGGVTSITWKELKDKRDAGKLIPGSLYRITDYQCTTTQENTKSAGHQFDIVLLALSEDKLAEEGWAMEHPTDVYDVTFSDGTAKCYIYDGNVININTMLGVGVDSDEITIDEENKTASLPTYHLNELDQEGLLYNYFQNSKLEAWKVWYCLDNDTDRFAWALEGGEFEGITITKKDDSLFLKRNTQGDRTYQNEQYYAWNNKDVGITLYTKSATPDTGDTLYIYNTMSIPTIMKEYDYASLASYGTIQITDGHGVIYRLIDEFGNDLPWDFKNILRVPSDGENYYYYTLNTNSFDPVDATMDGTCTNVKVVTEKVSVDINKSLFIIYSISKYLLSQCVLYINKYDYPVDWLIGTNKNNIIYGLEIYDPNA